MQVKWMTNDGQYDTFWNIILTQFLNMNDWRYTNMQTLCKIHAIFWIFHILKHAKCKPKALNEMQTNAS